MGSALLVKGTANLAFCRWVRKEHFPMARRAWHRGPGWATPPVLPSTDLAGQPWPGAGLLSGGMDWLVAHGAGWSWLWLLPAPGTALPSFPSEV